MACGYPLAIYHFILYMLHAFLKNLRHHASSHGLCFRRLIPYYDTVAAFPNNAEGVRVERRAKFMD